MFEFLIQEKKRIHIYLNFKKGYYSGVMTEFDSDRNVIFIAVDKNTSLTLPLCFVRCILVEQEPL